MIILSAVVFVLVAWLANEYNVSTGKLFANLVIGSDVSKQAFSQDMDDERLHEELVAYAIHYLYEALPDARILGVHLIFVKGQVQSAFTYFWKGLIMRKYATILRNPVTSKQAEFTFTFGFVGPLEAYHRNIYLMDKLVT